MYENSCTCMQLECQARKFSRHSDTFDVAVSRRGLVSVEKKKMSEVVKWFQGFEM